MLLSLEKEGMIPIWQEKIIVKCSVIDTKSLFWDIIYRLVLKIEFIDKKLFFRRGAVLVAPEGVDLILYFLFLLETIYPLTSFNPEELFSSVEYFLVMNKQIYLRLLDVVHIRIY